MRIMRTLGIAALGYGAYRVYKSRRANTPPPGTL